VSDAFAKALPGYRVTVTGRLALSARKATAIDPKDYHSLDLSNVYSICVRDFPHCDQAVALHVSQMAAAIANDGKPVARETLRVVVRPEPYVDEMRKKLVGKGDPVAVPFADGLWIICVSDLPTAIATLSPADLPRLHLSRDEAVILGKQNTEAALPPLMSVIEKRLGKGAVGVIAGNPYEASRLLLHDSWAPLAKRMKGKLLVSAPASDVVLYMKDTGPDSVDHMSFAAREVTLKARRALTNSVFRWTDDGWVLALPGDKFR
jgi:hypothetical protein